MTRITPASGAEMAHYYRREKRDESRFASDADHAKANEARRHYGNRRMGDRRTGERRTEGRRSSDRVNRHAADQWCSTQLGAHIIGQWIERAPVPAKKAVSAYGAVQAQSPKKGEVA